VSKGDRDHFNQYTPQNRIKHTILSKYFSAYMKALDRNAQAFHYIDGFAGGGLYENRYDGSPLIALDLLGTQTRPCSASFIEEDAELFPKLEQAIAQHPGVTEHKLFDAPLVKQGEFKDWVASTMARPIYSRFSKVATFAFVDPCGVRGVRMCDLSLLLSRQYSECLLFWNYDGINRWLGGVAKAEHPRSGLDELFGSTHLVDEALQCLSRSVSSAEKEQKILGIFIGALRHSGKEFVLPFRVQAKEKDRTSHYLIHCSGHPLAFKIMKDVMGGAGTSTEAGSFEFSSAAETASLFSPLADQARDSILGHLARGPARVSLFTEEWILRPDDFFRDRDYRGILLELEAAGSVEILDKFGRNVVPATNRPKRQGRATLGPDYFVRIRG
jgi:three-Cys-motif partner protein